MQFTLFITSITLASASVLLPQREQRDENRLIPPIPPCAGCSLTCAAVFAACAFVCVIPADPFCEVSIRWLSPVEEPIRQT